jgi:hypothetical protein
MNIEVHGVGKHCSWNKETTRSKLGMCWHWLIDCTSIATTLATSSHHAKVDNYPHASIN